MFYSLIKFIGTIIFKVCFHFKVIGIENIPIKGPVVIASNHASLLDPPIIGIAANRPVHFMAKQELFKNPILSYIFKQLGSFPVKRGTADRVAIKNGIDILKKNEVLAIFPEGTRNKTAEVRKPAPGALMMASAAKAVIVPVAVVGTQKIAFLTTFKVVFGKPIYLDKTKKYKKDDLNELSKELMKRIQIMLDFHRGEFIQ